MSISPTQMFKIISDNSIITNPKLNMHYPYTIYALSMPYLYTMTRPEIKIFSFLFYIGKVFYAPH
mgnify:CR=1 FL=1|jgi:hypothetical protein